MPIAFTTAVVLLSACGTAKSDPALGEVTDATSSFASTSPSDAAPPSAVGADAVEELLANQADANGPVTIEFIKHLSRDSALDSRVNDVTLQVAMGLAKFDALPQNTDVFIGYVTTPGMGKNLEMDATKPAQIQPDFDKDLAWVLRYHHVPTAGLGKIGEPAKPDETQQYTDMVIFMKSSGIWAGWEIPESAD